MLQKEAIRVSLDDEARSLCDYGLTTSQAMVYLVALRLGSAAISKISRVSGVRREDVYRMLEHLEELGLIERMPTKPTTIRALDLEQAISILIKRQRDLANRKISELTARKDDVLKHIRKHITNMALEEEHQSEFALLLGEDDVLSKAKSMIQSAQKELSVITSANEFIGPLSTFIESLEKAAQRHVVIRAILETNPGHHSVIRRIRAHPMSRSFAELRYSRKPLGHYFIVDFKQVLMATSPEPPIGQHPYLWTCDDEFAEIMCRNFEETWHACAATSTLK